METSSSCSSTVLQTRLKSDHFLFSRCLSPGHAGPAVHGQRLSSQGALPRQMVSNVGESQTSQLDLGCLRCVSSSRSVVGEHLEKSLSPRSVGMACGNSWSSLPERTAKPSSASPSATCCSAPSPSLWVTRAGEYGARPRGVCKEESKSKAELECRVYAIIPQRCEQCVHLFCFQQLLWPSQENVSRYL